MHKGEIIINLSVIVFALGALVITSLAFFIKRLIGDIDEIKKEMQKTYKDVAVLRAEVVKRNGFDEKLEKFFDKIKLELNLSLKECRENRMDFYEKFNQLKKEMVLLKNGK